VQALVTTLQALSNRLPSVLEARDSTQGSFLLQHLHQDLDTWNRLLQQTCRRLSADPAAGDHKAFRARLDQGLEKLEARLRDALNDADEGQFSATDSENFYRLLGAARSVSEALIDFAGSAEGIDWARWQEERFA
jgi:hypothetical protein